MLHIVLTDCVARTLIDLRFRQCKPVYNEQCQEGYGPPQQCHEEQQCETIYETVCEQETANTGYGAPPPAYSPRALPPPGYVSGKKVAKRQPARINRRQRANRNSIEQSTTILIKD